MIDILIKVVKNWSISKNIIKGSTSKDQYIKLVTEVGELGDAIVKKNKPDIEDAIGDILVLLINIAEQETTSLEDCLNMAYENIKDRDGIMYNGVFIKSSDPNFERIFEEVKNDKIGFTSRFTNKFLEWFKYEN